MQEVNKVLRRKGLKLSDLPADYQFEVNQLSNLQQKYNDACEDYENEAEIDEEEEQELDRMEEVLQKRDNELAEAISKLDIKAKSNSGDNSEPKKKGSGGLLLLGAVVLVVTLGSVNLFKK